jgi:NADPH:quinone reductase-like Zn-dependent oxidoreductase
LVPLPANMSFDEAATISGGATTAWQALVNEADIKPGDRVLIHGAAGGVGLYATQFAKWKGAYVIGTCGPANIEFVRSLGADEVIDYTAERFEEVVRDMDIVLDTVGGETLEHSWSVVKQEGMIISLVALPSQERAAINGVKAIKPMTLASNKDLMEIPQLIQQGIIKSVVSKTFALEQAGEAQALCQRGHGRGRIVLHIRD